MYFQIIDTKDGDRVVYTSREGTEQWKVMQRCGRMNFVDGGKRWRSVYNGSIFIRREREFSSRYDIRIVKDSVSFPVTK